MRIAIISTVGDCSWAGSEELWKLFATEALRRGHSVAAALQTPIAQSEELAEFRALGGVVFAYNPLNRYTSRSVRLGYSRFRRLKQWRPKSYAPPATRPSHIRPRSLQAAKRHTVLDFHHTRQRGLVYQRSTERDALRALYRSARRIICVSRDNASYCRDN
jgi:hypothetical protein